MNRDLSSIFQKFAGREVAMVEEKVTLNFKGMEPIEFYEVRLANDNDPVIAELRTEVEKNGLTLRLWWPGTLGTADMRYDRLNAHVEKEADGKWRIAPKFTIG